MIAGIHSTGNKTRMNMLMNRILPLILLLVISRAAAAEDVFWVLGSFVNEDVARVEGSRISNDAGFEVLLFETVVDARVQYRLLTGVLGDENDQASLRQQLIEVGIPDPWTLRFDDGTPYMETVFSDLGLGGELSAAELEEIDSMLNDFDDEYAEGAGTSVMDAGMSTEDIDSEAVGTSVGSSANHVVAGSYGTAENAKDYAGKLGNMSPEILSHEVTVRRSEVSGQIVYRVMIGPVLPSEEESLMASLSEQGVNGAWLLRGTPAPVDTGLQDLNQDIRQPQRGFRIPGKPGRKSGVAPVKSSRPQSDFNPVRLRKDPPNFPDPRDKH
jgi:hypothetical protein